MSTKITTGDYPALAAAAVEIADWSDLPAVRSWFLEREPIDNPDSAPQLPVPMTIARLMQVVSAWSDEGKEFIKALPISSVDAIAARVREGDSAGVANWGAFLLFRGSITTEDAAALAAAVNQTQAAPGWPATVAGPNRCETLLARSPIHSMDDEDIEAVRLIVAGEV